MHIEDQTAPIKREDISQMQLLAQGDVGPRIQMAARLVGYLNEKRDSYNGVISSLVYMIDEDDVSLLDSLQRKLHEYIATDPMRYGGKIFITRCLSRLTTERPKFIADFFARFLSDDHYGWEERIENPIEVLRIKIIALKAISQVEQKSGVKMTSIQNEVIDDICDLAILEGDDTIKIDTLYIVLDTKQATKVLGDRELDIFRAVFRGALNFQVPALRQKFLAIANKLLKRIRDSIRVVQREKIRYTDDDRVKVTKRYMDFLKWTIEFCLDNIYCNKFFGSFIITMTTLNHVIEHITLCNANLPIAPLLESRRCYDSILSCLALDSFEDNKIMALKLLFALPHFDQGVYEQHLALFDKIAYKLVNSVNPAHSLTCQYIFKLIIGIRQKHLKVSKNALVYEYLEKLVSLVEGGVPETKLDLVSALKNNAIHPKLTCIRALLDEIDFKELEVDRENWEKLTSRLVTACIESSRAVSSIVCNMNPETIGHLPMDLKPIDAWMLSATSDTRQDIPADSMNTITSQHLLITGWKTIKECSLSMGAMCSVFWWPESEMNAMVSTKPILKDDQIEAIIDYFEHYLTNLRHRGAFEQAYNGFIMLTKRIWLEAKFKNILMKNLNKILQDLKSEEEKLSGDKVDYLKKHVTRRSAGLPFLVQAIAVSEHRNESETLRAIMTTLIAVSNNSKAEAYQKIHCLNILKALMNDFNLGEKVTPYIGQVLLITIDAFSSHNFSIRNCANMLMRALVDRTFGVSRLRDEIHKRNTMSYEKFFTDYPDLHEKFKVYLERGLNDRKSFASVHAVFIVLFRLRPSLDPSDDFKIAKIVEPYMGPLFQLARTCPDFKLREIAAKLSVQLDIHRLNEDYASPARSIKFNNSMDACIDEITDKNWYAFDRNMFHGTVCLLKSWIELHEEIKCPERREQVFSHVNRFLQCGARRQARSISEKQHSYLISSDFMQPWIVALDLVERYFMVRDDPVAHQVIRFLLTEYSLSNIDKDPKLRNGPLLENLVFRMLSIGLAIVPRQVGELSFSKETTERVFEYISQVRSTESFGINLRAALTRLLRQFVGNSDNFVDKLMDSLDLDSTAAHMTPIDKLNQRSELDSEKELWVKYCSHPDVLHAVRSRNMENEFKAYRLYGFQFLRDLRKGKQINLKEVNSPFVAEHLALVLKAWSIFELDKRCAWIELDESVSQVLQLFLMLIKRLPDCDLKCLVLLCAANYFNKMYGATQAEERINPESKSIGPSYELLLQFTETLEELAGGQHDMMVRETCVEVLKFFFVAQRNSSTHRGIQLSLMSALIRLLQDETHYIRQATIETLTFLRSTYRGWIFGDFSIKREPEQPPSSVYGTADIIELICTKVLNPDLNADEDLKTLFTLITKIIFNHTKSTTFDVNEERESLFDKTKPNIFADHVATIHETLEASERTYFKRIPANSKLDVESIQLTKDLQEELSVPVIHGQIDQTIGDYSWRLKKADAALAADQVPAEDSNRCRIEQALITVKDSLGYFNYQNMLTDTSFGYHELSIYKRLAFVTLFMRCTNYTNDSLCAEIRSGLREISTKSCATTILHKCYGLFAEVQDDI